MSKRPSKTRKTDRPAPMQRSTTSGNLQTSLIAFFSDWGKYLIPAILVALYAALELQPYSSLIGLAAFLSLAYLVASDFFSSDVPDHDAKEKSDVAGAAKDIAISLGAAIAAWLLLSVALNTSKPMNVVTSCSMLPVLHRGDLVFLQGGNNYNMPIENIKSPVTQSNIGLGTCTRNYFDGHTDTATCMANVSVNGRTYSATNLSNDIIVYEPLLSRTGLPYPDLIIHRAVIMLNHDNITAVLTKGDNNDAFDQAGMFMPAAPSRIDGKVVMIVPAIGFLKIFLFAGVDFLVRLPSLNIANALSAFDAPAGCDSVLSQPS